MYTLIFCHANDGVAHALYDALFQKKERKLRLVTDAALSFASWLHEADSNGVFFTRIRLHDGFIIEPGMIGALVNRIAYFPMPHFIEQTDRQYAEMEMVALYTSFLYSIKDKVIDGMPVRHINTSDNTLYYYAHAVKAGIDVLDNQFTSSPRWQHPKKMTALVPEKKENLLWHKKSPSLVWENKPVLYYEPFSTLVKVEVVADQFFYGDKMVNAKKAGRVSIKFSGQFQQKIKSFSKLTGRTVYELTMALAGSKYKLYAVNTRPLLLSAAAIEAFAALIIKKIKN